MTTRTISCLVTARARASPSSGNQNKGQEVRADVDGTFAPGRERANEKTDYSTHRRYINSAQNCGAESQFHGEPVSTPPLNLTPYHAKYYAYDLTRRAAR